MLHRILTILIEDVFIHPKEQSSSKEIEFSEPSCDLVDTKIHHGTKYDPAGRTWVYVSSSQC